MTINGNIQPLKTIITVEFAIFYSVRFNYCLNERF